MSLFDELDLGAEDYSQEKPSGLGQFTSKPSPKPYQPFGGPIQQAPQTFAQPQYYEQPQTPEPKSYNVFSDDELDTYERAKKDYSYVNNYATSAGQIASKRKANYDDFMKGKLMPFFEQVGGFGEFDDDDELAASIDEMESLTKATSQMDDGWFGPSDEKVAAGENLKNFQLWSSPNGLRDQYRRLRAERDRYQGIADAYKSEKIARLEQLTSIPIPAKQALDDALKSRGKKSSSSPAKKLRSGSGSSKDVNSLLDGMQFEQPMYDGSGLANPESVDPRSSVLFDDIYGTEKKRQSARMDLANRGDVQGLLSRRQYIARERQLRDKGFFFSESGLLDGRPIGLSRRDVDLLDIDDMRKAGMTSYQGRPLDEAMAELGGEERLEMAKVMESVYSAKSNYEDAQLKFLKVAGSAGASRARKKMDEAREAMEKSIGLAAGYGLDNELFEQAETTGWLSSLGNAIDRGMLMSEMSNYTPDFLTNTLDADEMQRFIEIASEMEKLPTSSTMKRYKESDKSGGLFDAIGKLLFDNTGAIPELFFESMSAFLPSTLKWLAPTAGAGAATGAAIGAASGSIAPGPGTAAGAAIGAKVGGLWGARLSFASASFVLEASGMALESMQELNIDWKNPKVFAAAWTNESIRNKIQKKMAQKGIPIAIADAMSGMMAGKVMGVVNHTGNAAFKGGKLLNKEAFNKSVGSVPRFTLMQKTKNAAAEIGADSVLGMGGEYLGQWASKESGEAWDWDAVAAEGVVGIGPGFLGAALSVRSSQSNYFGDAPIEISGEENTEVGTRGTITRAGYNAPYQTFNDPDSMMAHFEDIVPQATNPEDQDRRAASLDFTRRWVNTMFKIRPEAMAKLKVAISPRTPDANLKNRGTFETRDGHDVIYLNEQEFAADPMGTMLHESGHFARILLLEEGQLMKLWGGLKDTEQLDAYAQYYTKEYEKSFEDHDENTQKKIQRAFNKTDNEILAEEWFSYQWAKVIDANYKPDKSVKELEKFYSGLVRPLFAEYTGTENTAGKKSSKAADEYIIDRVIQRFLADGFTPNMQAEVIDAQNLRNVIGAAYEEGFATQKEANQATKIRDRIPGQLQQKLKSMGLAPKKAAQIARTLNAMAGEKILSTDPSAYTSLTLANMKAAGSEVEKNKNLPKSIDGGVQPFSNEVVETKKTKETKKEYPKDKPLREGLRERTQVIPSDAKDPLKGKLTKPKVREEQSVEQQIERVKGLIRKEKAAGLGWAKDLDPRKKEDYIARVKNLQRELQNLRKRDKLRTYSPAQLKNKPKSEVLQNSESTREANLQKQIAKTKERLKNAKSKAESQKLENLLSKLTASFEKTANTGRSNLVKKPSAEQPKRDMSKMKKLGGAPGQKLTDAQKKARDAKELVDIRSSEMALVTKSTGMTKAEYSEATEALRKVKRKFTTLSRLESAIRQYLVDTKKSGNFYTTGGTIASVLDLESLVRLAPTSFIGELEKAMDSTLGKIPNAQDIEDMALEAREQVESKKELIESRIAEIDREIRSLQDGFREQKIKNKKNVEKDPDLPTPTPLEEISDLMDIRDRFQNVLQLIAPERLSLDWKDVPHSYLWYRLEEEVVKTVQGKRKKIIVSISEPQRLTLGMMADPRSYEERGIQVYSNKRDADKEKKRGQESSLTPQEELWDFVTGGFDETFKSSEIDKYGVNEDGTIRTLDGYKLILQAVKASAMFPKQRDVGTKPKGRARYAKDESGKNIEARKGYPSGYTVDNGANLAAVIAELIREKKLTGVKKKGSEEKAYLSIDLVSDDPTLEEVLGLAMANGRTLELLGDPSDSMKDFDQAMFIVAREKMKAEMIEREKAEGSKTKLSKDGTKTIDYRESTIDRPSFLDGKKQSIKSKTVKPKSDTNSTDSVFKGNRRGGVPTDIDQETDYAEQAGDPWPKVQGSAPLSKTLAGIVSTKARIKFHNDYINHEIESVQSDINGFSTSDLGAPNQILSGLEDLPPALAIDRLKMYVSEAETNELFPKPLFQKLENKLANLEALADNMHRAKSLVEANLKSLDTAKDGNEALALLYKIAEAGDPELGNKMYLPGFNIKPEKNYNYRRPLERTSEKIAATNEHDGFTASKIYETFDVMSAFAAGRTLEGKDFNKEQTNIGKSETMPDRPIEMSRKDADLLSSVDINAVDFANWYIKGKNPEEQMRALQNLPSSQSSKDGKTLLQLPGGLGEGLLPYVFMDFAKSMYEKLNITGFESKVEGARKESAKDQKTYYRKDSELKKNLPEFKKLTKQKKDLEKAYDAAKTADEKAVLKDGIDNLDKELQSMRLDEAPQDSNFKWNFERGELLFNGKPAQFDAFLDKEKRLDPKAMAVLGKPIVQAVLDAEAIDVYRQTDPYAENMLQRDTQKGGAKEDNSADMRDDSGNEDTQVAKSPKEEFASGTSQFGSTFIQNEDIEGRVALIEQIIDNFPFANLNAKTRNWRSVRTEGFDKTPDGSKYYIYDLNSLRDDLDLPERFLRNLVHENPGNKKYAALLKDFDKLHEGLGIAKERREESKKEFEAMLERAMQDATQSSKPKTLNSDARTLTSDADQNLSKLSLLTRLASAKDELKDDAKAWAKAKKESLKEGSFKMNLVDRADPLKQYHGRLFKVLKKAGLDEKSKLYSFLNTHGRYHQYFGKGYNTVEQAQLNYIQPLKDLLREYGISQTDFGRYLIARAAPSRNLQLQARIDEMLADIAAEEKGGIESDKYKKERAKYYDGDTLKVNSGLDTDTAVETVKEIEANVKNFKKFAEKALPIYYAMNLASLNSLSQSGMIQQGVATRDGKPTAMQEETAMVRAMSRYSWAKEHPDVVQVDWSILDTPPPEGAKSYSYAPLQGFEGETEQYFDNEAAWEEFGAGSNATGKGMDQPKAKILLKGAFGRDGKTKGPNPDLVFANSINQFFDNSIRAHKNEVAQSFGTLYESILRVVYPEYAKDFEWENVEARNKDADKTIFTIEEALGDNREALVEELKEEFDKIFEPEFKPLETKKMYDVITNTFSKDKKGDAKIVSVTRTLSTEFRDDPTVFVYRRDGVPKFIKLKETPEGLRMADAMKNLKYETLPSILNFFNIGTRGMAQMFTSMNPAFILPNFFRDLGTAAIHLSEDHKKKILKESLKGVGIYVKAIFKAEKMIGSNINPQKDPEVRELMKLSAEELAKAKGPKADIARYQYAKQQGSKIGYFRHKSVPELIKDINTEIQKNKDPSKSTLKKIGNYIESTNTAIENGIRISSFWAAVKNGFPVDEAAVIARNVTVDFNQKGNLTQAFGALYVFFGASVNSMHRFVTTLKRRSPAEQRKLIGGIIAASMAVALFNRLIDDDEEEEMPDYDTISTYKRDTNLIIPVPAGLPGFFNDEKDTGYFSMPLPLGYNLFWTMGQVAADFIASGVFNRGGTGLIGGMTRVKDSAMNAFNPIGGATLATIGMPTIFTPPMELYANKNFMGRPIRYGDQPFEVPKPGHMQDPKSTPQHWNDLSKAINEFMGGSDIVKGSLAGIGGGNPLEYASDDDLKFDMSGNQMRHFLMGYLGGPGQIADSFLGALYTAGSGKESIRTVGDIPILNRFMRATTYGATTRDTFYELRNAVKTAEKAIKTAKEIGPEAYSLVLQDNRKLVQLSSQISALDKQKNKLRRLRNKIEGSKALSEEQKTQRVDEIQKKELNLMVAVIKKAQSLGIS